jgi:hypothetical protein
MSSESMPNKALRKHVKDRDNNLPYTVSFEHEHEHEHE